MLTSVMSKLDALDVRRRWLRARLDVTTVARELGVTRQAIYDALKRADAQSPLVYQSGDAADREAMHAYVKACLERAHINRS